MELPEPTSLRSLTDRERAIVDGFLSFDFPGVEELRAQVPTLRVNPDRSCPCGCGTVDLVADRALAQAAAPSPLPVGAEIPGDGDIPLGGMIVFLLDGYLASLEVYSYGSGPLQLPPIDAIAWSGPGE
ncbi:hypothetical protein [Tsukamurella ocularis]|uniref:hypothetical protein n=1 Tax=Tsukamurella ocularis TaxID=1970234 RepID=UPI00216A0BD6|nr:hypothetical protein [Tsukamurella ocularis]MCS3781312.1 hypothetical protein [Tsukamurella ocularis]MCS3787683.1 hypothetical protein [Tsukamurella ocularis]MCS3850978.1 hypothetical protein [Tsukamurella ocularis]